VTDDPRAVLDRRLEAQHLDRVVRPASRHGDAVVDLPPQRLAARRSQNEAVGHRDQFWPVDFADLQRRVDPQIGVVPELLAYKHPVVLTHVVERHRLERSSAQPLFLDVERDFVLRDFRAIPPGSRDHLHVQEGHVVAAEDLLADPARSQFAATREVQRERARLMLVAGDRDDLLEQPADLAFFDVAGLDVDLHAGIEAVDLDHRHELDRHGPGKKSLGHPDVVVAAADALEHERRFELDCLDLRLLGQAVQQTRVDRRLGAVAAVITGLRAGL